MPFRVNFHSVKQTTAYIYDSVVDRGKARDKCDNMTGERSHARTDRYLSRLPSNAPRLINFSNQPTEVCIFTQVAPTPVARGAV